MTEDIIDTSYKYLDFAFVDYSASGKTELWAVISKHSGADLGWIKWYGRWRCYTFYPEPGTLFNEGCLNDIAEVCKTLTDKQLGRA